METIGIQTDKIGVSDVGTQTNRLPTGAVIIQKAEKAKKDKRDMKKRQIKDVPNAVPSEAQRFRIFKEIDYPYLMRNVQTQNEEDKMVQALREVFGIKEKTPEMVADESFEKSVIKGRSYPIYTDEELTQQEKRIKALNSDSKLKKYAGARGLTDDVDVEAEASLVPPELRKMAEDYSNYLKAFAKEQFGTKLEDLPQAGAKTRGVDIKKEYERALKREQKQREEIAKQARSEISAMRESLGIELPKPVEKRGRPAKEGRTLELPTSGKSKEQSALSIQQAIRNKIATKALEDAKINYDINKSFSSSLEQLKKQREAEDKQARDIQRSFGVYEASRKAKREGEMASLLFD